MKGTRLVDVLDDKLADREFWEKIFNKMKLLLVTIEKAKGPNMSIDDYDYRWVDDRIEYWMSEERLLTKDEMRVANNLWQKYK